MWKLFKDSSASRDTYINVNCSVAPQFFSKTSFIEDVMVADEAIQIWPYILNVIKHFEGLLSSKQPKNDKSYHTLFRGYFRNQRQRPGET